jgi:hypothetical protein
VPDIVFKGRFPPNSDFTTREFRGGFLLKDLGGLVYLPELVGMFIGRVCLLLMERTTTTMW